MKASNCRLALGATLVAAALVPPAAPAEHSVVERASVGPVGGNGAIALSMEAISGDGEHVYFDTPEQLVAGDTDGQYDIHERFAGATRIVTVPDDPLAQHYGAEIGGVSHDGSRVVFGSRDPYVFADVNADTDVFEYSGGTTTLLTTGPGRQPESRFGNSFEAVSADATRLIFTTYDPLVPEDTDQDRDLYERAGGVTRVLSQSPRADNSDGIFFRGASKDARTVVFDTRQPLAPEDSDTGIDLYASIDGDLRLVTPGSDAGGELGGVSEDGSHVFLESTARFSPADTDSQQDLYDWSGGQPELVSTGPTGGNGARGVVYSGASPDGSRVFFRTDEQLIPDDTDAIGDVYEHSGGETKLVAPGPSGTALSGVSGDGAHVFFVTGDQLVAADTDDDTDVYDSHGGEYTLVSTAATEQNDGSSGRFLASSVDGSRVFFVTTNRMVAADRNGVTDVYERHGDETTLITSGSPDRVANFSFLESLVSPDGRHFYYVTKEALLPSDTDGVEDVYAVTLAQAYARPKAASPLRVALVPAYLPCDAPNRSHGPPLAHAACSPPAPSAPAPVMGNNGIGATRLAVRPGDPATGVDEADVRMQVTASDVRTGAGDDFAGELVAALRMRITDRRNGESGGDSGTVQDATLTFPVPCAPTANVKAGSACEMLTSSDTVLPGFAAEGGRAIVSLGAVEVRAPAGEVFLRQGVFVP